MAQALRPFIGIYQMMIRPCTIFIPLLNEQDIVRGNTDRLLRFMTDHELPCELVLGSNGSTDKTPEIITRIASEQPNVRAFHLPEKGTGSAFLRGVQMASNEFIVSLDADLSVELGFIPLALEFLERCDMVIGCKRMQSQKRTLLRQLGSNFFIFSAATLLGIAAADFSIGAKAYRKTFVIEHERNLDHGTAYVLELLYYAVQQGRRVVEFPVKCIDSRTSHFNLLAEATYKFSHLFRFARKHRAG